MNAICRRLEGKRDLIETFKKYYETLCLAYPPHATIADALMGQTSLPAAQEGEK